MSDPPAACDSISSLRGRCSPRKLCLALGLLLGPAPGLARIVEATPANHREQVTNLRPGDALHLAPGEYRHGPRLHLVTGTVDAPIVIRSPAAGERALLTARAAANTISIADASFVHLRDLSLDGRGIAVGAAKLEGTARYAHDITLENLEIIGQGNNRQTIGISTKAPAWRWLVRGNRKHGAGTGRYFGNSDGSARFFASFVEHNPITNPLVRHPGQGPDTSTYTGACAARPAGHDHSPQRAEQG